MSHSRLSVLCGTYCGSIIMMLGACTVGPDFVRPALPDTDRYASKPMPTTTVKADGWAQNFSRGNALPADWWTLFKSAPLDAELQQAIAGNPTLEAAEASLRQSQDQLRAGYGIFFPQFGAGFDVSRQRSAPEQQGSQASGTLFNLVTLSGTISYALDVFGGERRKVEGLRAQADEQSYAYKAAFLSLSANVVNTSIARAAYAAQIRATEQLIGLEREQLQSTQAQVSAGTAAYSNLLSVRGLIAANQALLAPLEQRVSQAEHLLALLEGVLPDKANLPDIDLAGLSLSFDLPLSLPSELVRQRPDILLAEAQLHAASANIGVATAAMLPSFSLDASYGRAGSGFGTFSTGGGTFWSIGPSVTIPLFQGGSLWFSRKAAIDAYRQSQANYRQAVLAAFSQVADALTALQHDAQELQAQIDAQRAAGQALQLLQANYRAGLVAYLDVLAADVQLHQANIAYLQATAQRYQDTVSLFVALGGGWWSAP